MNANLHTSLKYRLFFALWPDETLRDQLLAWQAQVVTSGRAEPGERLHMTLAFVGDVGEEQLQDLIARCARVRAEPVSLTLDCIGYFERPQIVWAGPSKVPHALLTLHEQVREVVQASGLIPSKEQFRPHITLARKANSPASSLQRASLSWKANAFHLVESTVGGNGSSYRLLKQFDLPR